MAEEGCGGRCCRCLASIPCATLAAWVALVVAVSACGGSLMIGAQQTRELLHNDQLLWFSDAVCLGVLFGTVLFGTFFLIIATISSQPISGGVFDTQKKNTCAKVLQVAVIIIQMILLIGWMAVTCVLSIPVMLLVVPHIFHHHGNLAEYGFNNTTLLSCADSVAESIDKSSDLLECYSIALVAAEMVIISLIFFIVCTASNFVHLKHEDETNYNVYKTDPSKTVAIMDTRM